MPRSREWLFERIRRAHREQGLSGRELAARFKVSRNTVKRALESPVPPKRKSPPPRKSVLEPVKGFIDAMLREDLDAPAKQKPTVPRIIERLAAEHDFELAGNTTVWDCVSKRRPQRPGGPSCPVSSRGGAGRTTTTAVGTFWLDRLVKRLPVGLDRLRQDRILEEAAATGADPLHLAHVFALSARASLRYANAASESAAEQTERRP
ncbi:HTH domain-containing protein [Kitasatospora sp. NPDC001603]|uniref:HTH domain-containing protein n=1 Tax=Kitasatospora sp. NPDC001603 TaxID=3154388 RepID=UPI0033302CFD